MTQDNRQFENWLMNVYTTIIKRSAPKGFRRETKNGNAAVILEILLHSAVSQPLLYLYSFRSIVLDILAKELSHCEINLAYIKKAKWFDRLLMRKDYNRLVVKISLLKYLTKHVQDIGGYELQKQSNYYTKIFEPTINPQTNQQPKR